MFILRMPKNLSQNMPEVSPTPKREELSSGNHIPWKPSTETALAPALLDIDWLTAQPLLPFLAQVAPAHLLYRSIMSHGMEDSIEVIEWVRGEQLQKIFDFDIWEHSFELQTNDISTNKFLSWLRIWMEIGADFAVHRMIELEEETIVLIFSKLFEIIPEGVSQVTEDMTENWWKTADNKFYLRMRDENEEAFELLKPFVDALYQNNVRIAASVFAHAAMLVRQESLDFGVRWKAARLADQGFVSREDALKILAPKKIESLVKSIKEAKELEEKRREAYEKYPSKQTAAISQSDTNNPDLFDNIVHFLSSLEPEEGVRYMQLALGSEKLKQITGSQNIDPSYFYEDEDFISESAENIIQLCNNLLMRTELVNTRKINKQNLLIEQAFCELAQTNLTEAVYLKDRVARLSNVFVSGIMNSIDNDSLARSLSVVRGILNIGLEICLLSPHEYGLNLEAKVDEVEQAVLCIQQLGPEYLFQLGWNILISLQLDLAKEIVKLDLNHPNYKNKLKSMRKINLSDASSLTISLDKLVENQRYPDMSAWLSSVESELPTALFLVLESLFGRVPMCSELLFDEKISGAMKVTTTFKPFETLNEIEKAKAFIHNFHYNLLVE
ncbi:DUF6178 family protein [Silvanigrella aquatica]|uniref:Uncharacterized protein n=1 Tax=Silvanigrella aquatica TaxID=1915309 RepID=A0A1L4CX16_9BACT|nr:DUF6178 family protein [Silvanigrella aquatica]APJ02479.1 hypothetical protein AXG55_00430 [Silvanigrella aquatica]